MSLKPIESVRWTAAFLLLGPLPLAAQQLDDSLLDQAEKRPARQWDWNTGEAGIWNVWLELDAGTIEQFDNRRLFVCCAWSFCLVRVFAIA